MKYLLSLLLFCCVAREYNNLYDVEKLEYEDMSSFKGFYSPSYNIFRRRNILCKIGASYLILRPFQTMLLAKTADRTTSSGTVATSEAGFSAYHNLSLHSGLSVFLAFLFDPLSCYFSYLRFYRKDTFRTTLGVNSYLNADIIQDDLLDKRSLATLPIRSIWTNRLDLGAIQLARTAYSSKHLQVTSSSGLKILFLRQRWDVSSDATFLNVFNANSADGVSTVINSRNLGVGAFLGALLDFGFFSGFSICSKYDCAIFWQTTTYNALHNISPQLGIDDAIRTLVRKKNYYPTVMVDLHVGIKFQGHVQKTFLSLAFNYVNMIFFHQNNLRLMIPRNINVPNSNLEYSGLQIQFAIDF